VHPFRAHQHEELEKIAGRQDVKEGHVAKVGVQRDSLALELLQTERDAINDLYRDGELRDEARRRLERDLDLREAALLHEQGKG
jgi:hypothetical protein